MDTASLMLNGAENCNALSMLDGTLAPLSFSNIEDLLSVSKGIYQRIVDIQLTVEKSVYSGSSQLADSSFRETYCGNKGGEGHEVFSAGSGSSE